MRHVRSAEMEKRWEERRASLCALFTRPFSFAHTPCFGPKLSHDACVPIRVSGGQWVGWVWSCDSSRTELRDPFWSMLLKNPTVLHSGWPPFIISAAPIVKHCSVGRKQDLLFSFTQMLEGMKDSKCMFKCRLTNLKYFKMAVFLVSLIVKLWD